MQEAESDARRHEKAKQEADEERAGAARAAREAVNRAGDAERQCQAARGEAERLNAELGAPLALC